MSPAFQCYKQTHTEPCLATMLLVVHYTVSLIFVSSELKAKCKSLIKGPTEVFSKLRKLINKM